VKRFLALILGASLVLATEKAEANFYNLFGIGGRSAAMGSAMTAAADDWTATYYNPALLTLSPFPTFGIGYSLMAPQLSIAFTNPSPAYAAKLPEFQSGINIGVGLPMPGRLGERLSLGVAAFIPAGPLIKARMVDLATPHFFAYDYAPSSFFLAASLGLKIFEWLRIGVGVHILASLLGQANMTLDIANGRFPLKSMDAQLFIVPAPIAGIAITPIPGLSIGVSYRGQIGVDVNIPAKAAIEGLAAELDLSIQGTTQWQPHQFNFGAAYMIQPARLLLAVDCTYALWSLAPDPSLQVALALTGDDIQKLGLTGAIDAPTKGNERKLPPNYFSNTFAVRVGAEFRAVDWLLIRAGYNLRPTPVPVQTSGTNLLDNDTHMLSLGLGFRFPDATKFFAGRFSIDATAQLGIMPPRQHIKDTADDPVGDLSAGGTIFAASVMLSYLFGP
jgi:long-chain fatty acid transport protein